MADIDFNCPHCVQNLTADESLVGSEIECPSCSKNLTIPSHDIDDVITIELPPKPQSSEDFEINVESDIIIFSCFNCDKKLSSNIFLSGSEIICTNRKCKSWNKVPHKLFCNVCNSTQSFDSSSEMLACEECFSNYEYCPKTITKEDYKEGIHLKYLCKHCECVAFFANDSKVIKCPECGTVSSTIKPKNEKTDVIRKFTTSAAKPNLDKLAQRASKSAKNLSKDTPGISYAKPQAVFSQPQGGLPKFQYEATNLKTGATEHGEISASNLTDASSRLETMGFQVTSLNQLKSQNPVASHQAGSVNESDHRPFCPKCRRQVQPQVTMAHKRGSSYIVDMEGDVDAMVSNSSNTKKMFCSDCGCGLLLDMKYCENCKCLRPSLITMHFVSRIIGLRERKRMGFCLECDSQLEGEHKFNPKFSEICSGADKEELLRQYAAE